MNTPKKKSLIIKWWNLLTGCLTFYNTVVQNIEIKAFDLHCEDSVNFINTNGNVYSKIGDSLNDGLDIDSSELEIKNIVIEFWWRVDLSSGNYKQGLELIGCSDKRISIGESSIVEIKELNSSITKTGIAVKDSSKVVIENFFGENNKYCLQLYQKKQEFGPSKLTISNNLCNAEMNNYIQKGSIYESWNKKEYKFISDIQVNPNIQFLLEKIIKNYIQIEK